RREMPAAQQSHAGARGSEHLPAVPHAADWRDTAAGDCRAGRYGSHLSVGPAPASRLAARAHPCGARFKPHRHVSSGVFAARPAPEKRSMGRFANRHARTGIARPGAKLIARRHVTAAYPPLYSLLIWRATDDG